ARYATRVWAEADLGWRARRRGWLLARVGVAGAGGLERGAGPPGAADAPGEAAAFERDRLLFCWKNLGRALTARHLAWLPWQTVRSRAERRAARAGLAAALSELGAVRRARRFERTMARLTDRALLATFEGV